MDPLDLIIAGGVLAIGTFAFRFAGPVLKARFTVSPKAEKLMTRSAVVLLAALVAVAALTEGHEFAGYARPAGVLVGGVLAWRKAPFALVVVAAAATAALLRLAGVP
ncbi:AzlD domain-containing protein [Amycolatopsis regifaucium]|uniref:Branched-chain amino acid transporter n=1 Tax=Amycolatopsis regifaucium TaxID=546365 RepID=A0A154MPS8_9PSEU|nr:AzlD domain-containing protein [Amycolatopsis regifaucium]KZB86245.1 branched-chain amino acid transporter [Amycolatopsis regifaucium]OKA05138.1 branched-chain amino acid transporter [Amycolatopsis regifaucium]SFH83323.1 Branched-chain amino acid transport protein (AzlD) [Amycolatopsis regifaucium]